MVYKQEIIESLRKLGLKNGQCVVVHSSLSSFGTVDGGADCVIDAILEVLGSEGTLVMPTYTYSERFDTATTASLTGSITETMRKRPNAMRSLHPTHSVTAIGEFADVICADHEKVNAFARGSALFKVLQANGRVLLLGVDQTTNSMIHVAEEIANVPYIDQSRPVYVKTKSGKEIQKWIRMAGCSDGFMAMQEELETINAISSVTIGNCLAQLMNARDIVAATTDVLSYNAEFLLCNKPNCQSCATSRAIVAAAEAQKVDEEVIAIVEEDERVIRMIEEKLEGGQLSVLESDSEFGSLN